MPDNGDHLHHRRTIRLPGYDYASQGAYFVTICTDDRAHLFGVIEDDEMHCNVLGEIAADCWREIPVHFPHAAIDAFVVMPNYVHGIVIINDNHPVGARHVVGVRHASPLQSPETPRGTPRGSLGAIVGSYKSAVSRQINTLRGTPGVPVWQRNYYEHIVRDDDDYMRIVAYISDNPRRWADDREHPANR